MENIQPQQSVWDLLKDCVPDSELPEIRTVLGEGLIDMYTEIYSEMHMWEQIWQEVQSEKCRPQIPRRCITLTDPPAIKDLLRAELQLLLLTLQEKAARLGRNGDDIMSQYSPRVVSYALGDSGRKGSPGSQCEAAISPSRTASSSSNIGSRSSPRLSSRSSCEDEIEGLRHKLNVTHIDEVVSHLKSCLTEECEALKKDIQFLQESVDLEFQKQRELELMEPTLTELKEERRIIQRDLHVQSLMSESSDKLKPGSSPVPSREVRLADFPASNSEMENPSASPVLPRMSCLYPNPSPPHFSRPVHSGKARHRLSHKVTQPLPPSPSSSQPQTLDLDHSHTSLSCLTSTTSSTEGPPLTQSSLTFSSTLLRPSICSSKPREEAHAGPPMRIAASRLSPAAGLVHGQHCGSSVCSKQLGLEAEEARARTLMPTPPAVQKVASRGQQASRRLTLPQAGSLLSPS
ncbi:coiled-coil domain-containing protein 24 [Pygocentrus nattereri]|uniref:Coiled-coil domain containing 24 n=1 Tax=Pygocentrus nattereri TaxID=42514 RepID=A0A3B4BQ30_PYGNA|nr:coiled-coil domain-containing protein 24 [Pygocentrus nattereri]XP_037403104.1 coiled-coil domain-containing protein 24 [Pygocentrus nattereri]XP_037403108.1 coiled-coil domain-containing protein 24 [Pygocentrus nattereri]